MRAYHANQSWPVVGLPGSSWLEKVPSAWNIPVNAIVMSGLFTFMLSLINIGEFFLSIPFVQECRAV